MKKLTTLFSVLALVCASSAANADVLNLPNSGVFIDNSTQQALFDFPANGSPDIFRINSISMDLTHTFAGDVQIVLAGPAGANFILALNGGGAANLGGRYTFVESGSGNGTLGSGGVAPGTYDAFSWTQGPMLKQGWVFNFIDTAGLDQGTWGGISIDFDKTEPVPEPTSALIMLGVAGLAIVRRRR